jgi:sugar lactone lactonase YvrE
LVDAGNYEVVVTNAYGSVTSQVATLAVATQPTNQTVYAGTNLTLSVAVNGTGPFTYQWQVNGTNLPNNIITTVAGNGSLTYSGDGGAATSAGVGWPNGVYLDAVGKLYIADTLGRIREVDPNGIITTVAGGGTNGLGDGGEATNASLSFPTGVVLDSIGNLYIADLGSSRIRKVTTNGVITTMAGGGTNGLGNSGEATNAMLEGPVSVALDGEGNLYIGEQNASCVQKVDTNGIITTVVIIRQGDDEGEPQGIAFDATGNLYVADSLSVGEVEKVSTTGIVTIVAGGGTNANGNGDGGPAIDAALNGPNGVALDAAGDLYIGVFFGNRIRKVDTNGIITTVAGNGVAGDAGDGGAATNANLKEPAGVALDAAGNLYIADYGNGRVREVHFAGSPTLLLSNVSLSDAGDYSVVITGPYGSVTSAVANLIVTIPSTPPQIITNDASFGFVSNQFGFNVKGAFGQTVVVDGSANLMAWSPLSTNTVGNNLIYFSDPASTNTPCRFYRARLQ